MVRIMGLKFVLNCFDIWKMFIEISMEDFEDG